MKADPAPVGIACGVIAHDLFWRGPAGGIGTVAQPFLRLNRVKIKQVRTVPVQIDVCRLQIQIQLHALSVHRTDGVGNGHHLPERLHKGQLPPVQPVHGNALSGAGDSVKRSVCPAGRKQRRQGPGSVPGGKKDMAGLSGAEGGKPLVKRFLRVRPAAQAAVFRPPERPVQGLRVKLLDNDRPVDRFFSHGRPQRAPVNQAASAASDLLSHGGCPRIAFGAVLSVFFLDGKNASLRQRQPSVISHREPP